MRGEESVVGGHHDFISAGLHPEHGAVLGFHPGDRCLDQGGDSGLYVQRPHPGTFIVIGPCLHALGGVPHGVMDRGVRV